jgi:hypothetical protein
MILSGRAGAGLINRCFDRLVQTARQRTHSLTLLPHHFYQRFLASSGDYWTARYNSSARSKRLPTLYPAKKRCPRKRK